MLELLKEKLKDNPAVVGVVILTLAETLNQTLVNPPSGVHAVILAVLAVGTAFGIRARVTPYRPDVDPVNVYQPSADDMPLGENVAAVAQE